MSEVLKQINETGFKDVLMEELRMVSRRVIEQKAENNIVDDDYYDKLLKIDNQKIQCFKCKIPNSLTYDIKIDKERSIFELYVSGRDIADKILHSHAECFAKFYIHCDNIMCYWNFPPLIIFDGHYKGNPVKECDKALY